MSVPTEYSPPGDRIRQRRGSLATLLPVLLLLFAFLTWPAVPDCPAAARAKGKQYGAPLKFEPPPVDIDTPAEAVGEPPPPEPDAPAGPGRAAPPPAASGGESPSTAPGGAAKPVRLFGTVEFRSPIKNLPKWERVRNSEQAKPSFAGIGMDTRNKAVSERWRAAREKLKDAPLMEKIKGVNNFFNQWPYKTDIEIWGVEDYWETPREFVERSGDCEDYAISKYYALRDLGLSPESLRIVAVKDSIRNLGHAVLAVFVNNDAYVLDNLTGLILSHKRLTHYKPQFSVNENTLWRHIQPQSGPTR